MIAEAVKHMLAAGMDHAAIVLAIADMEKTLVTVADPVAERRRAYDRERKRAKKESGGNPVETAEETETPSLDKESFPQTPFKEIKPNPVSESARARTRGSRLPEGWKPETCDADTKAGQAIARMGQGWAKDVLETFTNHWRGKAGRDACKVDWQATWANWVIEQDRRDGRNGGYRNGTVPHHAAGDGFTNAIRESRARREASERGSSDNGGMFGFEGVG